MNDLLENSIWSCAMKAFNIVINEQQVYGLRYLTFFRQLIYNYPEQLFADKGVMAIEHADFEGVERLALVTG